MSPDAQERVRRGFRSRSNHGRGLRAWNTPFAHLCVSPAPHRAPPCQALPTALPTHHQKFPSWRFQGKGQREPAILFKAHLDVKERCVLAKFKESSH